MMSGLMSVVGGAVQAMGAMQQAEAEAKAHEYNAAVAERNRETIKEQAFAGIRDQVRTDARQMANIRGKFAANGITMGGSALDVMVDTRFEQELGIERTRYAAGLAEIEQIDTKNLELMGAENARKAGKISAAAALLGGLSGAVSSFGGGG